MRIFGDASGSLGEIKRLLFGHKAFMKASGMSSYRKVYSSDNGDVLISSIAGIDNIILERAAEKEKKSLEEFVLPKKYQGRALIWTGLADQSVVELGRLRNLTKLWGSEIYNVPVLPDSLNGYELIFIYSPFNAATVNDLEKLRSFQGKIILHLGTAPSYTRDDTVSYTDGGVTATIVGRINVILASLEDQPLRAVYMFSDIHNDYRAYADSYWPGLFDSFSGLHQKFRFNSHYGKPFIVNGGPVGVDIDSSYRSEHSLYYADSHLIGDTVKYLLYDLAICTVLSRGGFDFVPAGPNMTPYTFKSFYSVFSGSTWWTLNGTYNYSFEPVNSFWNPSYGSYGWDAGALMAYYNNVFLSMTGDDWFAGDILDSTYSNVAFILALLLENWNTVPYSAFKPIVPFLHDAGTSFSDFIINFYSPGI